MEPVVLDMSMSLDGFVAGPNVGVDRPMGDGGERLHAWMSAGRTDREAAAFEQAQAAAGDRQVTVMGGAAAAQQFIKAGLLDELQLHLVPVLLGDGVRLFDRHGAGQVELEPIEVVEAPGVTHLRFRRRR